MAKKVETTDKEREKNVKKDMEEIKKRYDTVNEKLWNLETRMDTMIKDQAESSCAIRSKLDALLRNSLAQDKSVADKQPGFRVDFVEPRRKKRESTPFPRTDNSIGSGKTRTAMKGAASNSMRTPGETSAHTGVPPDAMTLKCVVAKKEEERDTADKIFEILLNRFGSGMKGHQAMMSFEKKKTKR